MNKKILVTGATGFIGANLVRALIARGDEVHVIARKESSGMWRLSDIFLKIIIHDVDLSNAIATKSLVDQVQPEQVFHLAHYGGNRGQNDESLVRKVIIDGSASVFEACALNPCVKSIVNAGSSSEYGSKIDIMSEDMTLEPNTGYGTAKAWVTLYGQHLAREKKVPITTLRFFSVYGPYEARTRLIPAATLAFLNDNALALSNPETTRDFIHVDDVVSAMLLVSEKQIIGEVFNIGSGVETTLKEMVNVLQEQTGSEKKLEWGNLESRSFDGIRWQANLEHTKRVLGWHPSISLVEGARKTVEWIRDNKHLYASQ